MKLRLNIVMTARAVLFVCLLGALVPAAFGASQTAKRLRSNIDDSETFILEGNTRPAVSSGVAHDLGSLPGSQLMPRMYLRFSLTAAQQADLIQLLADQQNRRSSHYRQFLTPEQYADRFGLNTADIAKVTQWLENNSFSNIQAARSRASVSFTGTVAQAQSAFHTSIHAYLLNGQPHIANVGNPELPKALSGVVESVEGLHNFVPKPHYTASTGTTYLAPDDWETIYDVKPLYSAGLDGSPISGQTYSIAVVGQAPINLSDLHAFRSAAGLAIKDPVVVTVGAVSSGPVAATDQAEATFDLEWAGGIAKNGSLLYLEGDPASNGVLDAFDYAVNNNVAPIISVSYGTCEQDLASGEFSAQTTLLAQAASFGITVIVASGNDGAAACDTGTVATQGLAVDFPASSQYATGVGGTEFNPGSTTYFGSNNSFNGSALSYVPEITWNDGNLAASGGGASTLVSKPSWQTGTGVPTDGQRDVPDLAVAASSKVAGLLFCNNGSCTNGFLNSSSATTVFAGTSAGPPALSGVVALLVQKTGARVGLLNTNLYSLAAISSNAFHDITAGNNEVTCQGGSTGCPSTSSSGTGLIGYSAGVGYDQATGLGSIDSYNLVEQWNEDIQVSASPAAINVLPGGSATSTITVTPVKGFTGPVSFACSVSSNLTNVSCSVPSTTVNTSGSITLTVSAVVATSNNKNNKRRSALPPPSRFPHLPPMNPFWWLAAIAVSLAAFTMRKHLSLNLRAFSTWAAATLLVLTVGAVSCGSGSSAGTLSLSCNLPEAFVDVPYNGGDCVGSGGKGPYTYTIETSANGGLGPLPPGLSLASTSGLVTGTPTNASVGVNSFTVSLTDSESTPQTVSDSEYITVGPAPVLNGSVVVTATSGGISNSTTISVTTTD